MPTPPTTPPAAILAAPVEYARPLGHRLSGKFHRLPLVLTGIAIASLFLPWAQAHAAVVEPDTQNESVAAQIGLEPVAQQREGRRGGGEMRGNRGGGREMRGNRGGGNRATSGGREFRGQSRSNIGTARTENRQQFRQERRADRQDFQQNRRGDRQDFRQNRRGDRQDLRQGTVNGREFRAERRNDQRDFRAERRNDRRDFRQDRRVDNRNLRNDRRGYDNRGRNNRGWNNGWRNDRRYDWRGYRNQNRNFFRAGRYYAPVRGWNYRRLGIGFRLGAPFFASSFWINDPWAYRLPPAYGQYRWVRYYGDVLLVDIYTGQVVDVINDFFW